MLIAVLALLGVDLAVVVALATLVIGRRVWLKKQSGQFAGAIRVSSGDFDGLSPKWRHGSGRWVRDVLVWSKAPFMFRNELVPVDGILAEHLAPDGEVKRLGDSPVVIEFECNGAKIQVAAKAERRALVAGPLATAAPVAPSP